MQIDAPLLTTDLGTVAAEARALETIGYDGTFTFEGPHLASSKKFPRSANLI